MRTYLNNFGLLSVLSIFVLFTMGSCRMSQTAINSGDYEYAVKRSVDKLRKNKKKSKAALELEQAYNKAVDRDLTHIGNLHEEGLTENAVEIFDLYNRLESRQRLVQPLLPLFIKKEGRNARIKIDNYNLQLVEFKKKAADYLYKEATSLLETDSKFAAREAFRLLKELDDFYPGYLDIEKLMGQANIAGTNKILFEINNETGIPMPPNFESELNKISLQELNRLWADFHMKPVRGTNYDYKVAMNVNLLDVGPEQITEDIYTREKEINDGWDYVLDKKGNVMKDSLGNDIKVDRFKTIFVHVTETYQRKEAQIAGTIDFIDLNTNQIVGTYPVSTTSAFTNRFGAFKGDERALTSRDKNIIRSGFQIFPSDFDLILKAMHQLKPLVKDAIVDNESLVLN